MFLLIAGLAGSDGRLVIKVLQWCSDFGAVILRRSGSALGHGITIILPAVQCCSRKSLPSTRVYKLLSILIACSRNIR